MPLIMYLSKNTTKAIGLVALLLSSAFALANPWEPGQETNSVLWLDASDASTITTGTTLTWADKSGAGNNATQTDAGEQAATGSRTINGLNAFSFDVDSFDMPQLDIKNKTLFVALEADDFSEDPQIFSSTDSANNVQIRINKDSPGAGLTAGTLAYTSSSPYWPNATSSTQALTENAPAVVGMVFDATATTGNIGFSIDGNYEESATGNDGDGFSVYDVIGKRFNGSNVNYFDGAMGEIVVFDGLLDKSERQKAEGYLANKWGLTANLVNDHPFKLNAPTTAAAALTKINNAAIADNASSITIADIASIEGMPEFDTTLLSAYQTAIAAASSAATDTATEIIALIQGVTYENNWTHSQDLTLNTKSSGADVSVASSKFPLLIRLNSTNFDFSEAQTNGEDIRFANSDVFAFNYEIERWDSVNELAEIWVQVDRVRGDNSTQFIVMYWGNSGVSSESNSETVFDSTSRNFEAVYHMNEAVNTNAGGYIDATSNNNDATGNSMDLTEVEGTIGKAQDFLRNDDYISVPDAAGLNPTNLTASAWVKHDDTNVGQIMNKGNNLGWRFRVNGDHTVHVFDRGSTNLLQSTANIGLSTWAHVAYVADATGIKIYINGELDNSNTTAYGSPTTTDSLMLGQWGGNQEGLTGQLDEARVSRTARGEHWIKLSYENQKADQSLVFFIKIEAAAIGNDASAITVDDINEVDGVSGAISANLVDYQAAIAAASVSEVDSAVEIQALVDSVNAINKIKLAATGNNASGILIADLNAVAGVSGVISDSLADYQAAISALSATDVNTAVKIQALVDQVNAINVIEAYAGDNTQPEPTEQNFTKAGITGVTAGNLAEVNAAIDAANASGADTAAEIQAIVDAVNAINVIEAYADDNTNSTPSVANYADAGVTGVSSGNIAAVNTAIDAAAASGADTASEIQAIVDQVTADLATAAAINVIEAYADSNANPTPVLADYSTAGVTGVTSGNIAAVNAAIDAAIASGANSAVKIQAIVDQVIADLATAAAVDVIEAYADSNSNPTPVVTDYSTAGVTGVTSGNIAAVNTAIDAATASGADSAVKIQAIVDQVIVDLATAAAIDIIEAYADDNTNPAPSLANYADAGVTGVTTGNLAEMNAAIDAVGATDADSTSEIQAIADSVTVDPAVAAAIAVIEAYADSNSNPTPVLPDYSTAGVTGVTSGNIAAVNTAIDAATASGADSTVKIQAIVDQVIADLATAAAVDTIEAYADNNTNTVPLLGDYTTAGITGVTATNLDEVNAAIDALGASDVDSASKIQSIVNAVNAGNVIEAYADSNSNPAPTQANFTAAGIAGVTVANLAEINAVIDALTGSDVDSISKIQSLVDAVNAGNVIEAYADSNSNPAPTQANFTAAGINGVTAGNLAAVNAEIDALVGTDVDTTSEIQDIVDAITGGDNDGDGLTASQEAYLGTDPNNANSNSSSTPAINEADNNITDGNEDLDGDGLPNDLEFASGFDPLDSNDPVVNGGDQSGDNDGLTAAQEAYLGTDPTNADSDSTETLADEAGNNIIDANEDSDGDTLSNGLELASGSDPLNENDPVANGSGDTDSDGLTNAQESYLETDPSSADSNSAITPTNESGNNISDANEDFDNDGISNALELASGSGPLDPNSPAANGSADGDLDGLTNAQEAYLGMDPNNADSDSSITSANEAGNNITDANEDTDGDTLPNDLEFASGSDPLNENDPVVNGSGDTDSDGLTNAQEMYLGSDPAVQNSDSDKTNAVDESTNGILDDAEDFDGDGVPNLKEFQEGSDPLNQNDPMIMDDDGDTIANEHEDHNADRDNNPATNWLDTDGNGTPNYLDADSDGDGIDDINEVSDSDPTTAPTLDNDGDGIPDFADVDSTNVAMTEDESGDSDLDGVSDATECPVFAYLLCPDSNQDGQPDYMDPAVQFRLSNLPPGVVETGVSGAGSAPLFGTLIIFVLMMFRRKSK